jgi:hypothetical protein
MINAADLPSGSHFWAKMDNRLVMMMKDGRGDYYVCGGWECPIREEYFEIIEIVPRPVGHEDAKLYYA